MIKTVNNKAEYEGLAKDTFESSVVFLRSDNVSIIDGLNTCVEIPQRYDIVCLDEQHDVKFIRLNTFEPSRLSSSWETVGYVDDVTVEGDSYDVLVVYKDNTSAAWADGYSFKLESYVLDGTDRTGTLNVCDSSDWATRKAYTISYNATTVDAFVKQLNAYFKANEPFITQDWVAEAQDDGSVFLTLKFSAYQQASNTGSAGFKLTGNLFSRYPSMAKVKRKHGMVDADGAIGYWYRALAYYRNDNGSSASNGGRTSVQTSIKQKYPINLPTWLGTSEKNPGSFCENLWKVYGTGEAGWLRFMESCKPEMPSIFGNMGDPYGDSLSITRKMSQEMRMQQDGTQVPFSPMAVWCQQVSFDHDGLRLGEWASSSLKELYHIVSDIKYSSHATVAEDPANKALSLLGNSRINNSSGLWSCSRHSIYYGWGCYGSLGLLGGYHMYSKYRVLAVAHLKIRRMS